MAASTLLDDIIGGMSAGLRPRNDGRWKAFSLSEHVLETISDDWEVPREAGNAAFKRKDYRKARKHYGRASILALGPRLNGAAKALREACLENGETTAARAFGGCVELVKLVVSYVHFAEYDAAGRNAGCSSDESRRRRGRDVDIPRRRVQRRKNHRRRPSPRRVWARAGTSTPR